MGISLQAAAAMSVMLLATSASGQVLTNEQPVNTDICTLGRSPERFAGRLVTVRGFIDAGVDTASVRHECAGHGTGIYIDYPTESLHPPKANFSLERNADFAKLDTYLNSTRTFDPQNGICIGCERVYCDIWATITGRFDVTTRKEARRAYGFGGAGRDRFRLVIKSVSNPTAKKCPPAEEMIRAIRHQKPKSGPH